MKKPDAARPDAGGAVAGRANVGCQTALPLVLARAAPGQNLRLCGATVRLENDLFAGTGRNHTNGVVLALMRVWRSRESRGQHGHHAFGSIAPLSVEF